MGTWFNGQQDMYWVAWYEFGRQIGARYDDRSAEGLAVWMDVTRECHWLYPFLDFCLVSDKPIRLHRDLDGNLHSDESAALEYSDGWALYRWHGIEIPERAIKGIGSYTAREILSERNTEVRRALMSLYGWERILPEVKAKMIDSHPDPTIGELYEFFISGDKYHVALVQDGTPMYHEKGGDPVYRKYAIATRTSLNDIVSSLKDTYPLFRNLTNEQYLQTPRT